MDTNARPNCNDSWYIAVSTPLAARIETSLAVAVALAVALAVAVAVSVSHTTITTRALSVLVCLTQTSVLDVPFTP